MSYQEKAVTFGCGNEHLVGVISLPHPPHGAAMPVASTGVVIVVGGPQYRAGSHRQFVLLARALASAGTHVLRFDYRGMGDSTGELHTFENVNEDIEAAISALQMVAPSVQYVALWGLCDGASAALLYCHATKDVRVKGLCLLNPWVRSEASLATTQVKHYYVQRLKQQEFWAKLLSGKVAASAVSGLMRSVKIAFAGVTAQTVGEHSSSYQTRMAQAWIRFQGPMLLILSGNDYTAKEFLEYVDSHPMWAGALRSLSLERHDLPKADHTFSAPSARRSAEDQTIGWLQPLREMSHEH
jgi:exosortase A-associated hydrolase 1